MTHAYLALLRGINVGGKNKIAMAELKTCLESLGCTRVQTYIASGNVVFESAKNAAALTQEIEALLPQQFALDSKLIKILLLSREQLQQVVSEAPKDFGTHPELYHSDVIFLMGITAAEAMQVFKPREGVDTVWQGRAVVYSQRLSAERTKSRLSAIMTTPLYKSMTIRTWGTTSKLLDLLNALS